MADEVDTGAHQSVPGYRHRGCASTPALACPGRRGESARAAYGRGEGRDGPHTPGGAPVPGHPLDKRRQRTGFARLRPAVRSIPVMDTEH